MAEVIGIIGLLLILIAFALEEFTPHTRHESIAYNMINIAGASFLGYYALSINSLPFVLLNSIWVIIALFKLSSLLGPKRRVKGSPRD